MKIVFLDRKTIGEDIDLSGFERFGEVVIYDYSTPDQVLERVEDADIIEIKEIDTSISEYSLEYNLILKFFYYTHCDRIISLD